MEDVASTIRFQEPLSLHTSFRIGGPADFLVDIDRRESLGRLAVWSSARSVPVFFIGHGSNLLVGDKGIRGVVARLRGELEEIRLDGDRVSAGAGVSLPVLARRCAENGLEGVEFLAGVPGTVGGALMTNAGTAEGRIGDRIETVDIVTPDGKTETLGKKDLVFTYRSSNLQGRWVACVGLKLRRGDKNDSMGKIRRQFEGRARTQPWGTHNAGCIFKNPPEMSAGRLIEQAGLKGRRIGDAEVSTVHANFIINRGKATARDVRGLIDEVRKKVRDRFRVELELEVRLAGE
ncbi:MAG TPA: UDP-N-acetylmuramate dehydrogenase [Elusimicrobiota bacterium]|nr:UDP-N-acetylmuramate dehydrogenase [Elusimicrobiota bacterium]